MALLAIAACSSPRSDDQGGPRGGPNGSAPPGPPAWVGVQGESLAALPAHEHATSTRFATHDVCAQCHSAGELAELRDEKGRDVSPVGTWKASAMALAARDPYYLAVVAEDCPRGCTHLPDAPDCAIIEAVAEGRLGERGAARLDSLQRLLATFSG